MLLLKVKALSRGHSGWRSTVQRLLDHWNAGVLPWFPTKVRSGLRLAPLAHLVLPLIEEVVMPDGRQLSLRTLCVSWAGRRLNRSQGGAGA